MKSKLDINEFSKQSSKKRSRNVCTVKQQTVIDQDGVVLDANTDTESISYETEPAFIKLYIQDIAKLIDMTKQEAECFYRAISIMGYNNIIPTSGPFKEGMMQAMGIRETRQFERLITTLKRKDILLPVINPKTGKGYRGLYQVNPNVCAKGAWKDIKKLRLCIDYDTDGNRLVTTNVQTDEDNVTITNFTIPQKND